MLESVSLSRYFKTVSVRKAMHVTISFLLLWMGSLLFVSNHVRANELNATFTTHEITQTLYAGAPYPYSFDSPSLIMTNNNTHQYINGHTVSYICTSEDTLQDSLLLLNASTCTVAAQSNTFIGGAVNAQNPSLVAANPAWYRNYNGVYSAHVLGNPDSGSAWLVGFHHGENKNDELVPNTINTNVLPSQCTSGGSPYTDCFDAYNAFIGLSRTPYTSGTNWGRQQFVDYGPVIWPEHGYIGSDGSKVSWGVRHPSTIVVDNYIYMYYLDTVRQGNEAGCIHAARAAISPESQEIGPFFSLKDGVFSARALPAGFSKDRVSDFYTSKPEPSDCVLPSLNPWSLRFSVAKINNTSSYIGVEWGDKDWEWSNQTNDWVKNNDSSDYILWLSEDLIHWRKATTLTLPYTTAPYTVFANKDMTTNYAVDINDFYLLGSQSRVRVTGQLLGPTPTPVPDSPLGYLDAVTCENIGGWSGDPDATSSPVRVDIYTDNPTGTGEVFLTSATANMVREAGVCSALGYSASTCPHGFSVATPASIKDGQPHNIYAYGVNVPGTSGESKRLMGSPKSIVCDSSAPTPTPDTCDPTDINRDGITNLPDYSLLATDFMKSVPANPRSDMNKDGVVNLMDYSLLVSHLFQTSVCQ